MTKIVYDNDNKSNAINNINECINDLNIVNDIFLNIDIPYDFKYKNDINNIRESLKKIKEDIFIYKNDINRQMEEINKNELEISSLINKIEDNIVSKFE